MANKKGKETTYSWIVQNDTSQYLIDVLSEIEDNIESGIFYNSEADEYLEEGLERYTSHEDMVEALHKIKYLVRLADIQTNGVK